MPAAMRAKASAISRQLPCVVAAAATLLAASFARGAFCGAPAAAPRVRSRVQRSAFFRWSQSKGKSKQAAYPNLARLEDVILESCQVDDPHERHDCMATYEKLLQMHFKSQQECDIESLRCVVLEVIDRMSAGISSKSGLAVLANFRDTVEAFQRKFHSREEAFDVARGSNDGVDKGGFRDALAKAGLRFPDMVVDRLFMGADANHDGAVSKDEFNDFMLAGIFASEPIRRLAPQHTAAEQHDRMIRWATAGRAPPAHIL